MALAAAAAVTGLVGEADDPTVEPESLAPAEGVEVEKGQSHHQPGNAGCDQR
jgi:hypothetical protein